MNVTDLNTKIEPTWCTGCGDFGIWSAFKRAAVKEGWNDNNCVLVAGIGCHGHIVNFVGISSFEGLHGRAIPVASGIKMVNNDLNVFVFTGDGDGLAEGANHFIHAARRNHNITVILHDNAIYGLTTGQTSPRSPKGFKSKSTPAGSIEEPFKPLNLALSSGATFLARAYAGDIEHLSEIITKANRHKGFSVVDVLQPCVSFNREYTHNFYQKNIYHIPQTYDKTDKSAAFEKTLEWGIGKIPVGILYDVDQPSYEEQIPQIANQALVKQPLKARDVSAVLSKYS